MLAKFIGRHRDLQYFALEGFGLVLDGGIGKDDAHAFHVPFVITQRLEEAGSGFRDEGEQLGVVEMAAVVDMALIDADLGGKGKSVG